MHLLKVEVIKPGVAGDKQVVKAYTKNNAQQQKKLFLY